MTLDAVDRRIQTACLWCGPALMVLFLSGFAVAGFIPPLKPTHTAAETARYFDQHRTAVRAGVLMAFFAAPLFGPWSFAVACQMRRMPGDRTTPLSTLQLCFGVIFILEFIFPAMIWEAAAYRPLDDPHITQRLNDIAWLMFIAVGCTAVVQALTIAVAILRDTEETVYPRWLAYVNIWAATIFIPASVCVFTRTGPLAWNGLLPWWIEVAVFTVWLVCNTAMTLRAINAQPRSERRSDRVAAVEVEDLAGDP